MSMSSSLINMRGQQGIGLIEVMVSLLLLAVAIMGFSAMQMSAVKATDESLMRTRALTVIRGGAEIMRLNPNAIPSFAAAVNGSSDTLTVDSSAVGITSCMGTSTCTPNQLATRDGLVIRQHAVDNNLNVNLITCPGTGTTTTVVSGTSVTTTGANVQCFVASWGTTAAVLSDTAPATTTGKTMNCATSTGVYNPGAQCFILEAY